MSFEIDTRTWPPDMRFLLEKYPREAWVGHANLGETAQFWLQRHGMFRELGGALSAATAELRAGNLQAAEFQGWFARRLQFFLSQLHAHHQVEDHHYFPLFRGAEPKLTRGFEVLENDHEAIHAAIMGLIDPANDLLKSLQGPADGMRAPGDRYAEAGDKLLKKLLRHLDDEEDLIIPLILDRGREVGFA